MNLLIFHGAKFDEIKVNTPIGPNHVGSITDRSTWKATPFWDLLLRSYVHCPSQELQHMYLKALPPIILPVDKSWLETGKVTTFSLENFSEEEFTKLKGDDKLYSVQESGHSDWIVDKLSILKKYFEKTSIFGKYGDRLKFSCDDLDLLGIEIVWLGMDPCIPDPCPKGI